MQSSRSGNDQANALVTAIFNSTKDFISAVDGNHNLIFCNHAYKKEIEKLYGITVSVGTNTQKAFENFPEDRINANSLHTRAMNGESFAITQQFGDASRARNFYELHYDPLRDEKGNIVGVVHIAKDVTKQKKAEMELQETKENLEKKVNERTLALETAYNELKLSQEDLLENRERLRHALRLSSDGLWVWDLKTGHVYFSPRWLETLGFEKGDIKPHVDSWNALVHPDDKARVRAELSRHLKKETAIYECRNRLRMKDGTYRYNLDRGMVVEWNEDGKPLRMIGVDSDITRLVEAENKLKLTNEELKRSNEELEMFASVASHDLQEPLRKIISFVDMLKIHCQSKIDDRSEKYLEIIQRSAERMSKLTHSILDFSRITTVPFIIQKVTLKKLVKEVKEDLEMKISETGAKVKLLSDCELRVNKTQFRQVLFNLINNSIKFRKVDEMPVIQINSTQQEGSYIITLTDNGIGLEQKYAERIFQPFQRLHSKSKYEGNGIGLAICKKIVERHNGNISLKSQPGKGTDIIIHLPLATNLK